MEENRETAEMENTQEQEEVVLHVHRHLYPEEKELKKAKKLARIYEYTEYVDNGISYAYMAEKFGCSIKTMVEIVKFATKKGFLVLKKNVETFFAHGICWRLNKNNSQFTFTTKNYAYIVHANSYSQGEASAW